MNHDFDPFDLNPFDLNFRKLSYTEFIALEITIADSLSVHCFFKDNWPGYVPGAQQYRAEASELRDLVAASAKGDRDQIAARNEARARAERSLTLGAQYIVARAVEQKDGTLLQNTGFPFKGKSSAPRQYSSSMVDYASAYPTDLRATHGKGPGTAVLKAKGIPSFGPIEVHVCKGDPFLPESWSGMGHHKNCRKIELKGLESANRYHFRLRYDGPEGPGPWTPPVPLIIL